MTRADESATGERTYRCPYCPAEYPTELLARVHVSYADDSRHADRDGMTPEVEPIECDANGEQVGTAFTLAGQLNLHELSLSDIPAAYDGREFDERERRALLVAALNTGGKHPETELADRITTHLAEHDLEPLSTGTVRDLCEHVFHPVEREGHAPGTDEHGPELTTAETRLRDLTALQQALILAHLARPESDRTAIATRVGTARSYPTQVIDARPDLVARLRSRLERTSLERLVAECVPAEDLAEIKNEGYLNAFEIDLAAARERKRRRSDPGGPVSDDPARDGSTTDGVGRASPAGEDVGADERTTGQDETASVSASATASDGTVPLDLDTGEGGDGYEGAGRDEETVPRVEVEAVREQVAFDLAVVEQEMELADPTPQQVRTKAYLEQILERLDDILS